MDRVLDLPRMTEVRRRLRDEERRLVLTNGCFDVLHVGHVRLLATARELGDALVVALNADESVRRLKGPTRPVNPEQARAEVLAALRPVDYVVLFSQDTPLETIQALLPDILVKGGDWPLEGIVGRDVVEAQGGRVVRIPLVDGFSTTRTLERLDGESDGAN